MPRFHGLFRILGLSAAVLWVGLPAAQTASLPSTGLVGTVKSSDGKPLEGVAVSARAQDKTFATSVYTNQDGEYFFPSSLTDGPYRIWAQAVGFQIARSERTISSGKKIEQNFILKPFRDFHKQLSGTEWTNSLPVDTPEDRRMQRILHNNCTACHVAGFVLAKRFDATGWGIILDTMINKFTKPEAPNRLLFEAYKEDLVQYLARVRGPEPYPLKFKPSPRASGEATQIVVTEYDVPRGNTPDVYFMAVNGSDWSEGIPGRYEGVVMHDAVVGKDGNVYFSDNSTPERTVGKLDPKTGRVTGYKLADKDGFAVRTHGVAVDPKGNIWLTNGTEGTMVRFDPRTEKFQRFPKPGSMTQGIGGMIRADSKGNMWTTQPNGAFRLNPETGEYTEYKAVTPKGSPYGITVDGEDNAWFAQIGADRVGVVNGRNGEVSEVVLPPVYEGVSAKDREIGERSGAITNAAPLFQRGPRRLAADQNGDAVWVAEYWTGQLSKINMHTMKVTAYKVPERYSHPYAVVVDKNHMVWIALMNSDRIARFNPFTEQFTEYPLPTLGTNNRFIDVDNSTSPPTIWVPYTGVNKMMRMEFRSNSGGPG